MNLSTRGGTLRLRITCAFAICTFAVTASDFVCAQSGPQSLDGMWSDPPLDPVDFFCAGVCTQAGIDRLNALLDDPSNDDRPLAELISEAGRAEAEYVQPRFAPEALERRLQDPLQDPGYLNCEPWGLRSPFLPCG